MRLIGPMGLHIVQFFESWSATAYDDDGDGNRNTGNTTIGWGHKILPTDPAEWTEPGFVMSPEDGLKLLQRDLEAAVEGVRSLLGPVTDRLNQNQYDALVSFVFNLGPTQLRGTQVVRALQNEEHARVPGLMRQWRLDNGKVSNGLVARRAVEAWLYALPVQRTGYNISAGQLDEKVLADLAKAPAGSSVVLITPTTG